jgi:hypothetical protein
MIRDQMDREHSASIRRHYRHLDDLGGQPPAALLDELAKLAERHADDILAEETSGVPRPALPSPEAERAGEAEDQLAEAADTVTDYRAALNDMQEDRDRYRQLLADAGHIAADKGVTLTKRCEAIRQLAERELAVSDA